ncbi:MAG TPA: alkaline phosphatase family protein [Bryobacteraceae bacterium]|nr:alkaline phosphatase family protein [Bryobacteraceae bacterium]
MWGRRLPALALLLLTGCHHKTKKVIVIGVDGMDPGFVERHWSELPNLSRLRQRGSFSRLRTTTPPQSPVAWSTFITGLDPDQHGIYDFVHRDPKTRELFLSTDRTIEPRFKLPLGPYELPLWSARVESLRKGEPFWKTLTATIVRIPGNYPPFPQGREIAGMGTPDLRGTQSTFSYYTDEPDATSHPVAGGLIRKITVGKGSVDLSIEGPPNSLRRDHAYSTVTMTVDIDPDRPVARLQIGDELAVIQQGEWSDWLLADFPLIPHVISARGMFRVFAKQLHPNFELYVSPVNIDPARPALPVSHPTSFAKDFDRFYTIGIPEDTSAIRQDVFDLPQFLLQTRLVLNDERHLLTETLDRYRDGFLFFYFSSVDENSHILWGKHEAELLDIYRAVDASIGETMRRVPDAALIVMSDHGFTTFDRAVNLNTWLSVEGLTTKAYAAGLNALYLTGAERTGADRADLERRLLAWRDPKNGRAVIETLTETHPSPENREVAPDLIVGYSPGYRASWATGLGETPDVELEDNNDAWIADHCINAADVPGVLFAPRAMNVPDPSLKNLSTAILRLFQ